MKADEGAERVVFCTSLCANYLGKALALGESVKRWMPNAKFVIALVEKDFPVAFNPTLYPAVDHFLLAKDIVRAQFFESWIFRYSIVEASTAIKGHLIRYLYQNFRDCDSVVYLDPDTYVYSAFDELFEEFKFAPILITPHLEVPGNIEMEVSSLKHGVFNLGFLALRKDPEAEKFINWWTDRLDYACYDRIPNGIFTDQKWVNLAPCFFHCRIFRHPGYNFATWSLLNRKLSLDSDVYKINELPLRFAHFSGFDSGMFHHCIERWALEDRAILTDFAEHYDHACRKHGANEFSKVPWSYGKFYSGRNICRLGRVAWREKLDTDHRDPFSLGNIGIFLSAIQSRKAVVAIVRELIKRYA